MAYQGRKGFQMNDVFKHARISRDRNFDGKFFFGVKTTGIFCRPSCPSPTAKEENVVYFHDMFEALAQHYRPCLRCRPDIHIDYYSGNAAGTMTVKKALKLIYDGYLNYHSVKEMAEILGVSDRHLRTLFIENLGVPPVKIARYHRALFAKRLLLFSEQSVTDIAFAAGFGSLRQFNQVFKETFGVTPKDVRKQCPDNTPGRGSAVLRIPYRRPFDFQQILSFMRPRAIRGVERVGEGSYARTFRTARARGYFKVIDLPGESALGLTIHCDDIKCYMEIYNRVRRMFDLNTDFTRINDRFKGDHHLSKGMKGGHVPRLPAAFDPFEFCIRAVLGQQISVKAATTLAGRIARKAGPGTEPDFPEGLDRFFPDPSELLAADLGDVGLTSARQATIAGVTQGVIDRLFSLNPNQTFEDFSKAFSRIRGVGEWTVNYVAMRGLGMVDSFPATDLGILKALEENGVRPSRKEILKKAERWRPYRAYAALCLWNG